MPRSLLRGLLHLLTLLSLLLSLVVAWLWMRSTVRCDEFEWSSIRRDGDLISQHMLQVVPGDGVLGCNFFFASDKFRPGTPLPDGLDRGRRFEWTTHPEPSSPLQLGLMYNPWTPPRTGADTIWKRLGFSFYATRRTNVWTPVTAGNVYTSGHVLVPLWLVLLATAALPAWRLGRQWRRERLVLAGHCPACGYDVRATPGVCPECGGDPANSAPPRLLLHSRGLGSLLRGVSTVSGAASGCLLVLWLYATAVPHVAPMQPGAAVQLFKLDTYLPALPPVSLLTLILLTALPPAARLAVSARRRSDVGVKTEAAAKRLASEAPA